VARGAVKTWVTLLVQDMGNTLGDLRLVLGCWFGCSEERCSGTNRLRTCTNGLSACTRRLSACTGRLRVCTDWLRTCTSCLRMCTDCLSAYASWLRTCTGCLSRCTDELSVCTSRLSTCTNGLRRPNCWLSTSLIGDFGRSPGDKVRSTALVARLLSFPNSIGGEPAAATPLSGLNISTRISRGRKGMKDCAH
jgi:hypothetical protein